METKSLKSKLLRIQILHQHVASMLCMHLLLVVNLNVSCRLGLIKFRVNDELIVQLSFCVLASAALVSASK